MSDFPQDTRNPWGDVPPPGDADPPAPVPPLPAEPEPPVAEIASARPLRFCGTCGAAWQPGWERCEACAARDAHRLARTSAAARSGEPEGLGRIKSSLGLYFTLLSVSMVMMVALTAGASETRVDIAGTCAMTVVVLAWCVAGGTGRSLVRSFRPGPAWGYGAAVAAPVLTLAIAFGVIETMHRALGMEKVGYAAPFLAQGYGAWVVFVLVAVQPAVVEELAFRGVVLTSLVPTLSEVEAVFVSALLFMTLHLGPAAFPHTFAMGVVAGFVRLRTGSLLPCVLMHFVHNAAVVGSEVYLGF